MPSITLAARAPFIFHSAVRSHGWYQLAPFEWDEEAGVLRRIERLDTGKVIALEITHAPNGVAVRATGRLTAGEDAQLRRRIAWMFGLDADFEDFYALADAEPRLRHAREKAYGRFLRSATLFEDVVKVMLTTNIQWGGTKRLARALVQAYGEPATDGSERKAFPTADRIARTRESALRKLGLGYRAPYLLALARGAAKGIYQLEAFTHPEVATSDLRKQLLALPGIGPYAAATLLGLLGRYDFIGVDSEAMSTVSKHFYDGQPVGEKEITAVFERWGRYKLLAYWFWDYDGMQQAPMDAWEAAHP